MTATTAQQAADILRENDPRTAPEQAAIDAIAERRWVLWHAHDPNLAVILLLSRAGLLRDKAHEENTQAADIANARAIETGRRADQCRISALDTLAQEAANRLDRGENPAAVAAWIRDFRTRLEDL